MTHPDELDIEVQRFGDCAAVEGIDLHGRRGERVGLLIPQGAGLASLGTSVGAWTVSPLLLASRLFRWT
ncbi:hypothetical protein [Myxococcus sp. Y35]|uniref:hypothetical protein n=1 Tax=Pseudomyxococcus flavus TaxID=3115648 RepID=UPI003CF1449C